MPTLAEQFPEAHQLWLDGGGDDEESFRLYLMATQRLPYTEAEYASACDQMKDHQEEIKQMGLHLPH